MSKTFRSFLLSLIICGINQISIAQQAYVEKVIIANGGIYETIPPYTDYVTVGTFDPNFKTYTVFDTIYTQSSQSVLIDSNFAYVAVQDTLIMYNIITYQRVASRRLTGINKMTVYNSLLIVTRGFGAFSDYVVVYDKNTLDSIKSFSSITDQCGAILIVNDTAYVGVPGNQSSTSGKLALIDLSNLNFVREIDFGSSGRQIGSLLSDGNKIYTVNSIHWDSAGVIGLYDIASGTVDTLIQMGTAVSGGLMLKDGLLYTKFGQGVGTFNINTLQIQDTSIIPYQCSSGTFDKINNQLYVTATNFSTYGRTYIYKLTGELVDSFEVGISTQGIGIKYITSVNGPYAPPAGQSGSTAIYKDSSVLSAWATNSTVVRGPMDISDPGAGDASTGTPEDATGKSQEKGVVSLGDGGYATLTFDGAIYNGPGYDFAVFENSFDDDFLELAFVEVSSDGVNFFRFDAVSLTQDTAQVGTFDSINATNLYNLAGKYRGAYGTPFDLEELSETPGLNIDSVTHVKIIDVTGSINDPYATYDSWGNKVNDPWPTPFAPGGFDLDAVGVINFYSATGINSPKEKIVMKIYPNPVASNIYLETNNITDKVLVEVYDLLGKKFLSKEIDHLNRTHTIPVDGLNEGLYYLKMSYNNIVSTHKFIKN
ncbi:T9SS type A sorting domain-containing protein [Bacteroidales bacterium AH-315-N07]|nr:T9SS type A sorting domain-containing protein [Bacteroidales bacterium AH-315-N07]